MPVALAEAFFLCVLSFFAVGMNHVEAWQFFYFWLEFSLLTLNGLSISRVLAFSLPANDVAQTLGPAVLLLFILSTGNAPQYLQLPVWLRWLSWISPCAYAYEGVLINEVFGRDVGNQSGIVYAQEQLGIPRIPYTTAASGLSSEGLVMAFDAYMLIIITAFFDGTSNIVPSSNLSIHGANLFFLRFVGFSVRVCPSASVAEMVRSIDTTVPSGLRYEPEGRSFSRNRRQARQ